MPPVAFNSVEYAIFFAAVFVAHTLPHIPGLEVLRDLGLAMYAALSWWAAACFMIYKDKCAMRNEAGEMEKTQSAAWVSLVNP